MSRRRVVTIVVCVLFLLVSIYWYRDVLSLILKPSVYIDVLRDKTLAPGLLGNLIGGIFTIIAGMYAFLLYFVQKKQQNAANFVEWISDLAKQFHEDADFCAVREKIASDHVFARENIYGEMLLDGGLLATKVPATYSSKTPANLDWPFIRKLTDYIYFLERVLAYGEMVKESHGSVVAASIVDHFGWFIRSLYHLCVLPGDNSRTNAEAQMAFIWYLADNRYRRLAEVGLYLLQDSDGILQPELENMAKEVCQLLRTQRANVGARDLAEIRKHWTSLIYSPLSTPH